MAKHSQTRPLPYTRRIVASGVCFRCSCSLQYMPREKGYFAAVMPVNGNEVNFHLHCALEEIHEAQQERRRESAEREFGFSVGDPNA